MTQETPKNDSRANAKFTEGVDYYFENGLMVLTAHFLLKRGYCCGNGCRHCPYSNEAKTDQSKKISSSSFTG